MPAPLAPIVAARDYSGLRESLVEPEVEAFHTRVVATSLIFVVSLSAVSFPTISKRITFLRIPRIVFFIGKHFGTGVILSTAFVHLLQDSFEALRSPPVLARWKVGNYVGLIVLCSLLAIFLVEYVSTSYVHRLHSYSSPSSSAAPTPRDESFADLESVQPPSKLPSAQRLNPERTPLIGPTDPSPMSSEVAHLPDSSYDAVQHCAHTHGSGPIDGDASNYFEGHHRHESRSIHLEHHERSRPITMYGPGMFASDARHGHAIGSNLYGSEQAEEVTVAPHQHHHHGGHEDKVRVGKRRQIVGILVLQVGIMIHSLIIGLTLSITTGPDFTTLLVAVIFHQLFEGLSLGIRIASLPSPREMEFEYLSMLKPTLACLFAITTPAGILLGIVIFAHSSDMAQLHLTQGIMSAISAGMLTYAACVEMLAGDFVMDPILWHSGVGKQALALFSLAAGVATMALVGS